MGLKSPLCGRVGGTVTAQVPLAHNVAGVVESREEVLGEQLETEGEGIGGGADQRIALHA
jgi:hypothetical protein